jgi:hypothetical protein
VTSVGQPAPVANILYATPIEAVLTRFGIHNHIAWAAGVAFPVARPRYSAQLEVQIASLSSRLAGEDSALRSALGGWRSVVKEIEVLLEDIRRDRRSDLLPPLDSLAPVFQ